MEEDVGPLGARCPTAELATCHCLWCGAVFCVHHIRTIVDDWICIFCINDVTASSLKAHTAGAAQPGADLRMIVDCRPANSRFKSSLPASLVGILEATGSVLPRLPRLPRLP